MRLFDLTKKIEAIAREFPNVNYIEETGDIYNLNAHQNVEYTVFCALPQGVSITDNLDGTQTLNNNYTLIYVDRLQNDQKNKLAIWSNGEDFFKYLLQRLYDEYGITYSSYNSTNFTERFNDECAGVYVTLTIDVNEDAECFTTYDEVEDINKLIRERLNEINGTREGKTILEKLDVTDSLRQELVANITYKGVPAYEDEPLNTLVPKVREIESVNLTPTNAFYQMDCGSYAQKYFNGDYPNVIVYRVSPLSFIGIDTNLYYPYDCKRVVINGVEYFNVKKGEIFDIEGPSLVMFCFDDTDNTQRLESLTASETGNRGHLTEIFCNGINVTGWNQSISKDASKTSCYLTRLVIKNNKIEEYNWDDILGLNASTNIQLEYLYFDGIKKVNTTNRSLSLNARFAMLPHFEEITNTTTQWMQYTLLTLPNTRFKIPFEDMVPSLRICTFTPWTFLAFENGPIICKHTKIEKLWCSNWPTAQSMTKEKYNDYYWTHLDFPNASDVRLTFGTTASVISAVRSVKLGKLTNFVFDGSLTRAKFLQNIEVGQDTDINLDIKSFTANYVFDSTLIDDTKTEALKVLSNVRNGLLNKVADHSTDGQTRTITLTTMLSNMLGCGIPEVVAEMESIINDFNAKGWTVI